MLPLDARAMARLANRTAVLLTEHGLTGGAAARREADFDLRGRLAGRDLRRPDAGSVAEVAPAAEAGMDLEPVYTGKALAAIRSLGDGLRGPVLWLNTHGPR